MIQDIGLGRPSGFPAADTGLASCHNWASNGGGRDSPLQLPSGPLPRIHVKYSQGPQHAWFWVCVCKVPGFSARVIQASQDLQTLGNTILSVRARLRIEIS